MCSNSVVLQNNLHVLHVQWDPHNSASKYVEEFGPIKRGRGQLRGPFFMGWQELCPGKSRPIKRDTNYPGAELSAMPTLMIPIGGNSTGVE